MVCCPIEYTPFCAAVSIVTISAADGLGDADSEVLGEREELGEIDRDAEAEGEREDDGDLDFDALALGDMEALGEREAEGDREVDGDLDLLSDADGERLADAICYLIMISARSIAGASFPVAVMTARYATDDASNSSSQYKSLRSISFFVVMVFQSVP